MRAENGGAPHLIVLAPESVRGRRISLDKDYQVVGPRAHLATCGSMTRGMVQHIDNQEADYIHYDERKYNWHVQNVNQQRENFLREVAATKTKARWLAWTGFLLSVVGFGIFVAADLSFIKSISDAIQSGDPAPPTTSPLGREIGGVPIGLAGWALAAVGMVLLIVGIVLHVVATSRRKQAYRDFPMLPPWPGAQPTRRG